MTDQIETADEAELDTIDGPEVASSITLKLFGQHAGKRVFALPEGQNELVLGTIIGEATGVGAKTDDKGEISEYLKGQFELAFHDGSKVFTSGKAYLPDAVMQPLVSLFFNEEGAPIRGRAAYVAFLVISAKAANKAGFTWRFRPLIEAEKSADKLALLRDKIKPRVLALTAPADEPKKIGHRKVKADAEPAAA